MSTRQVSLRIDAETLKAIESAAAEERRRRSDVIRLALIDWASGRRAQGDLAAAHGVRAT
jgi:uncharacterized protein (DUF1778 family)